MGYLQDMTDYVVVVSRTILAGKKAEFEQAMADFTDWCKICPGHLHLRLLQDSENPHNYTVVTAFKDEESRRRFTAHPEYAVWMQRLGALSAEPPRIIEHYGLAGFFPAPPSKAVPPRWKMALVTWIGVYPLSLLLGALTAPLPAGPARAALISAVMVLSLSFVVLPLLNRILRDWLFPRQ